MKRTFVRVACTATTLIFAAFDAHSHATLEAEKAVAATYYKAVMRIGHGCGSSPTTAVRIQIPEHISDVRPMPKPGWDVTVVRVKLGQPYQDGHGNQITERVSEIHWHGGRLAPDHYDEFVFRARLPDMPGTTLYLPTIQQCESGIHRWIEIPSPGKSVGDYKEPAPQLILTPRN